MRKTKQYAIFSILILSISHVIIIIADSPCGDWEPYKNEKCFKIFDKVDTQENAEKTCSQLENDSTLITIHSMEEQDFLSNLLFKTHETVENVWIGAKYTSNKIKWDDNSDASFTNWEVGSPKNKTGYDCIQMLAEGTSMGKWSNEPCKKNNLIICQKIQTWSLSYLQRTLLDSRKELKDSLEIVTKQLREAHEDRNQLNSTLENIRRNPVPIGFIYVHMPSQPEPKTLWSAVEWKDISSDYAGLFFRVEGGGSAKFGETQEENIPRITSADYHDEWIELHPYAYEADFTPGSVVNITTGYFKEDWDKPLETYVNRQSGLRFITSSGEVRPRNKAARIWKRIN